MAPRVSRGCHCLSPCGEVGSVRGSGAENPIEVQRPGWAPWGGTVGSIPERRLRHSQGAKPAVALAKTIGQNSMPKVASGGHLWGRGEKAWGRRDARRWVGSCIGTWLRPMEGWSQVPLNTTLLCRGGSRRRQAGSRFPGSSSQPAASNRIDRPTRTTHCNGPVRVPVLHNAWLPR